MKKFQCDKAGAGPIIKKYFISLRRGSVQRAFWKSSEIGLIDRLRNSGFYK
jgi:hypothetical protein